MSSVLILGRQTNIALAELESLYGAENFKLINSNCVLTDIGNIDLPRLGGSIKIAKVIDEYNNTSWLDIEKILHKNIGNFLNLPIEGKLNLGISLYGLNVNLNKLQNLTIQLKKSIKKYGQSVRLLPSSSLQLNSAQVIHNKLLSEKGAEILIIQSPNSVIIAKTIDEQDINSYSQRDYNRPKRDSKVGMLPPKLAQILINLANPKNNSTVLDPFCGTGVILQEALLDKFNAYGTDLEARMIDYSQVNMDWLAKKYTIQNNLKLETGDATNFIWQPIVSM